MECMLRSVRSQLPFSYLLFLFPCFFFFLRGNKNWNKFKHNFKYDDNLIAPHKDILFLFFYFLSISLLSCLTFIITCGGKIPKRNKIGEILQNMAK